MSRLLSVLWIVSAAAWGADFRAGAAAVKITPPAGMPLAGYYYNRAAGGVHDDLFAKALVLDKDGTKAALVVCDLIELPAEMVGQARELIQQRTGIPGECVMISATHAHTGPQLARRGLEGSMAEIARRYADELPRLIAESVRLAQSRLEAARVSAGAGREASLSFNRRFFMKDGSVGWNPGKLNPNIVRPAGPIDSDVPVVLFESAQGKPLATYLNFAMHLDTVGGTRISADYPCTLSALLGRVKGEGMLTLFTIGAAGNVNHIDVSSRGPQKGDEEAARIGTVLAGEVLKTYTRLTPVEASSILGRSETVSLPIPELPPGELEKAREVAPRYGKPNAAPFLDLVRAFRALDVASREGRPLAAEIQVITLGHQIAWVGLPGEIFVELGMAVKRASPFRHTIVVELANGNVGYVPDRKAYDEGAYEVVSARCAPGSGELMVATSLKLLRTLHSR